MLVDEYSDGHYAIFRFTAACPQAIETLTVSDQFLFDMDAQHKDLVSLSAGDYHAEHDPVRGSAPCGA